MWHRRAASDWVTMADRHARIDWSRSFDDELAELRRRRGDDPATTRPRLGLAISGGGIRSATFGLGVLQGLKRRGLLPHLDYLSTVSGGGYIGAWLSANCARHPGWLKATANWDASVAHLRRYSNYLSPKVGFFSADTWAMVTTWLRNALLIQVTVVLAIACLLVVPRLLFEPFLHWPSAGDWRWTTVALFVLGMVGVAGNLWRITSTGTVSLLRADRWPAGAALAAGLIAAAWGLARMTSFDPFHGGDVRYGVAAPVALLLVLAGFALQPVAVKLIALGWVGRGSAPDQVNYTQGWAQAVVVVPLVGAAYLMGAVLWGEASDPTRPLAALETFAEVAGQGWRYWPFPLAVVFVSLWLLAYCSVRRRRSAAGILTASVAPLVAVFVFHLLLSVVMVLLRGWAAHPADGAWRAFVWAPPLVSLAFFLAIVVLVGILGRQSTEGVREWWSRLAAWLGIYATGWMVVTVAAVYGPPWINWLLAVHPTAAISGGGGWIGTVLAGLFAGRSDATSGTADSKSARQRALEVLALVAPFVFIAGVLLGIAWALDAVILSASGFSWASVATLPHDGHVAFLEMSRLVGLVCLTALVVMAARVDINDFSLNAFYRNRLVRAYLGATRVGPGERTPQNFTGFDDADDLPMSALTGADAPLHVVNCTLNLGGSSDLALHTRHGAAFTMTPLACGSHYRSHLGAGVGEQIGYVSTAIYGGGVTLGQAIAVSGAAASPNSGFHTSPVVAFLLTLFNVRLGWWFPHPAGTAIRQGSPWFSLRYLIADLFGGAHDQSAFLSISDGGHFDNLGAYELVKRGCRLIVISDGECDPQLTFAGLGTLVRMCEVDFGAVIDLDVNAIRRPAAGVWSGAPYALGTIRYRDGASGAILYLKASMTGQEDTSVRQYQSLRPAFPHEDTGDQFYGEDQFESYRRLGIDVARHALDADLPADVAALVAPPPSTPCAP